MWHIHDEIISLEDGLYDDLTIWLLFVIDDDTINDITGMIKQEFTETI